VASSEAFIPAVERTAVAVEVTPHYLIVEEKAEWKRKPSGGGCHGNHP
jgi:hypothetical protein